MGLCMQDYKSLHLAVMIRATLVNTQTHSNRVFDRLWLYYILLAQSAPLKIQEHLLTLAVAHQCSAIISTSTVLAVRAFSVVSTWQTDACLTITQLSTFGIDTVTMALTWLARALWHHWVAIVTNGTANSHKQYHIQHTDIAKTLVLSRYCSFSL